MTPDVAVAYLHPGQVSGAFSMSLLKLMMHEAYRNGVAPMVIANRCGSGNIVAGRNEVVVQMLDGTACDWLLFVDSDMGFAPDLLERLLKSADPKTHPVVGALCFGQRKQASDPELHAERFLCFPTIYLWVERGDEVGFQVVTDYERDALVPTAATGAACILVHRRVLEKIRGKYGDQWFTQIVHPTGPTTFSEDMSFCVRVQGVDEPIHVDTAVKTSHDKGGVFLTEETWDAQRLLLARDAS